MSERLDTTIEAVELLPHLDLGEEGLVRIAFGGKLHPFDNLNDSLKPPGLGLPSLEIGGSPNTWKTSMIYDIQRLLNRMEVRNYLIPQQPAATTKDQFYLHSLTMRNRTANRLLAAHSFDPPQLTFMEHGILDGIAFLHAGMLQEFIDHYQYAGTRHESIGAYSGYIDGLILCKTSPETSLALEAKDHVPGPVMTPEFLGSLQTALTHLPDILARTRGETYLKNSPLLIAELDFEGKDYLECRNLLLRVVGTMTKFYFSYYAFARAGY